MVGILDKLKKKHKILYVDENENNDKRNKEITFGSYLMTSYTIKVYIVKKKSILTYIFEHQLHPQSVLLFKT